MILELPLTNAPQKFSVTLSGVEYILVVRWCPPAQAWITDFYDTSNSPILLGVPLVTGANLLEQYEYLGIGGQIVVQSDNDLDAVPTFENLGLTGHAYYLT